MTLEEFRELTKTTFFAPFNVEYEVSERRVEILQSLATHAYVQLYDLGYSLEDGSDRKLRVDFEMSLDAMISGTPEELKSIYVQMANNGLQEHLNSGGWIEGLPPIRVKL